MMKNYILVISSCLLVILTACTKKTDDTSAEELVSIESIANAPVSDAPTSDAPVIVKGDSADYVYEVLGEPTIEFPKNGRIVRIYEGYEVTFSNNIAVVIRKKRVESEAQRQKRKEQAALAEKQLKSAYNALAEKNKKEHDAWLAREQEIREEERRKQEKVEAYDERVSEEKRTKIIADAIKRSCGCRHGHCRH